MTVGGNSDWAVNGYTPLGFRLIKLAAVIKAKIQLSIAKKAMRWRYHS